MGDGSALLIQFRKYSCSFRTATPLLKPMGNLSPLRSELTFSGFQPLRVKFYSNINKKVVNIFCIFFTKFFLALPLCYVNGIVSLLRDWDNRNEEFRKS